MHTGNCRKILVQCVRDSTALRCPSGLAKQIAFGLASQRSAPLPAQWRPAQQSTPDLHIPPTHATTIRLPVSLAGPQAQQEAHPSPTTTQRHPQPIPPANTTSRRHPSGPSASTMRNNPAPACATLQHHSASTTDQTSRPSTSRPAHPPPAPPPSLPPLFPGEGSRRPPAPADCTGGHCGRRGCRRVRARGQCGST